MRQRPAAYSSRVKYQKGVTNVGVFWRLFDCDSDVFTRHTLIHSTFKLVLFQGWQHIKMSDRCSGMNRGQWSGGAVKNKKWPDFDLSWYLMSTVPFPHVALMCVLQGLWPRLCDFPEWGGSSFYNIARAPACLFLVSLGLLIFCMICRMFNIKSVYFQYSFRGVYSVSLPGTVSNLMMSYVGHINTLSLWKWIWVRIHHTSPNLSLSLLPSHVG